MLPNLAEEVEFLRARLEGAEALLRAQRNEILALLRELGQTEQEMEAVHAYLRIAERASSPAALLASEERFRRFAELTEDVFYIVEANGTVSYVSPAYEKTWRRPSAAIVGRTETWPRGVHPEDRRHVRAAVTGMRNGDPFDIEYRIHHPEGEVRWIRDRAFPVTTGSGQLMRMLGIARDCTNERQPPKARHRPATTPSITGAPSMSDPPRRTLSTARLP
jgi:PAS domain S-box-containing protein